jgi:hypothetical protein
VTGGIIAPPPRTKESTPRLAIDDRILSPDELAAERATNTRNSRRQRQVNLLASRSYDVGTKQGSAVGNLSI